MERRNRKAYVRRGKLHASDVVPHGIVLEVQRLPMIKQSLTTEGT